MKGTPDALIWKKAHKRYVVHATPGASTRIAVSVEVFVTYCNRKAYLYKLYIILFKKTTKITLITWGTLG